MYTYTIHAYMMNLYSYILHIYQKMIHIRFIISHVRHHTIWRDYNMLFYVLYVTYM